MANLAQAIREEITRLTRKEIKATFMQTKKQVSVHRSSIAALKRQNQALLKRIAFLEAREKKRLGKVLSATAVPEGSRFGAKSLRSQRAKTGLSQANYARLVGVSTLTINSWENGKSRPRQAQLAKLVAVRGLGKREAGKRLESLD